MHIRTLLFFVLAVCIYATEPYTPAFIEDSLFRTLVADDSATIPTLPARYMRASRTPLPIRVDNSQSKYFRSVFRQDGGSCAIASQIGYYYTYLYNAAYDSDASLEENQFPSHFIWNICNRGLTGMSTSFMLLSKMGSVNVQDWGGIGGDDTRWLSGYGYYYSAMQQKSSAQYLLYVEDEQSLIIARQWLRDMSGHAPYGGLFSFQTDMIDYSEAKMVHGSQSGKTAMLKFGTSGGHIMTIVGYDDSACYDFNGDGQYTNDIDINGDGELTLADREWGAFKAVNSWGTGYHDEGYFYIPYRLLVVPTGDSGGMGSRLILMTPLDTTKKVVGAVEVEFSCANRRALTIHRGISTDAAATLPEMSNLIELGMKSKDVPMTGTDSTISMGFDFSGYLSLEEFVTRDSFSIFLGIESDSTPGTVHGITFHDYRSGTNISIEGDNFPTTFTKGITWIKVPVGVAQLVDELSVSADTLWANPGEKIEINEWVIGGMAPYNCFLDTMLFDLSKPQRGVPKTFQHKLNENDIYDNVPARDDAVAIELPFQVTFMKEKYDTISLSSFGCFWFKDPLLKTINGSMRNSLPESIEELHSSFFNNLTGPQFSMRYEDSYALKYGVEDSTFVTNQKCSRFWRPLSSGKESVSMRFYKNGRIDCYIDKNFSAPDSILGKEIIMGLSDGYGNYQHHPITNMQELKDSVGTTGYSFSYIPSSMPEVCTLTPEGKLTLKSSKAGHWRVPVAVTDSRGVTVKKCIQFIVGETGVVEEVSSLDKAALSVVGRKLNLTGFQNGKATLSLYSLLGRKLYDKTVTLTDGHTTMKLPNSIHQGVVLVEVSQGSRSFVSKVVLD